jgi:hypothetical protein
MNLNFILSNLSNINSLFHSPLDQFGADSISGDFIGLFKCSFLDTLDILNLDELLDSSFLQSLFATFVSTYFYDDDDCADSE